MSETIVLPDRDREHERALGIIFNISPAQSSVLSCLARASVVTTAQLLNFTGAKSHIKVVVTRTRAAVADHDLEIHSKRNVGYWMDPKDRSYVAMMVKNFIAGRE